MAAEPNLRILYVDDEPDLVAVVTRALKLDRGLEVRAVDRGAKALDILRDGIWLPDVVLLDVMMPDLDGPGTLKRMSELSDDKTAVIFFTAHAQNNELVQLAKSGVIGILTKPFDPLSLAADIRRLVSAAR